METDVTKLSELERLVASAMSLISDAGKYVADMEANRETALVKTKLDEARMWLEQYQGNVIIRLANKTCTH
ncbi:hypothetical protein EEL33_20170 [Muribaculaceae bacterium Isolate-037 (Harlan)]|jgi:hypothetical protein|uniref:hypothetical protein n=1 Tax=uncultured Duncaniella sp. TaxID=2768039 RepID=UPI000F4730ED|nr:hypothetical protein [uncultured Duncaniella sp.]ROS87226.1 hypothetical protein EEL39_10730 [Muribaculaceae bacterium Isolate-080 (Janvier)]ROT02048.1 hypothetical protein EEL33_20170 [Muribaculaceae bacterium Isolate-037 (Harlan)]TKC54122.1 hypothetical protein E5359_019880 [Bacteroidales bacterium]